MLPVLRVAIGSSLLAALVGCHHRLASWQEVAAESGCTAELLASTAAYDSTRVLALAGAYRLIQVDTTPGWVELEVAHSFPAQGRLLRLWVADSVNARWRKNLWTRELVRVNHPIAGALSGYEDKGFSVENPQVEVTSRALNYLTVRFTPQPVFDGPLWEFPIERLGPWGFGGYFLEGSYVVPVGRDGQALGQRAGFYCAFRL
jgi:hypothetical protein